MAKEDPTILHILSDPMRWKILSTLATGPMQAIQIAGVVGVKPQLVNWHLRRLESVGLVKTGYMKAEKGGDIMVYQIVPKKWSLTLGPKSLKLRSMKA